MVNPLQEESSDLVMLDTEDIADPTAAAMVSTQKAMHSPNHSLKIFGGKMRIHISQS